MNMLNLTTPNIFKTKNKVHAYALSKKLIQKDTSITDSNYMIKPKHFPPYTTEWINSVYCYNKDNVKSLPSLDVNVYNLIKNYFNLYIIKYNNKTKTKRWRIRTKKSTTKKLIVSKPSMKHTNDKVSITIYTYDRSSIHYTGKIDDIFTLDNLKNKYLAFFINLKNKYLLLERRLEHTLKDNYLKKYLRNIIINKYKPLFSKNINTENYNEILTQNDNLIMKNKNNLLYFFKKLEVVFGENLNNYIKKVMWDEIISICYRQCISFEQSKYEKQHVQLLTTLLENIYNKKVVLDIVNLKYFYNSSSIFSNTILTKLKIKKNRVINVLGLALDTFDLPPINRIKVYDDMYNRKIFRQNASLKKLVIGSCSVLQGSYKKNSNDIIDTSLYKNSYKYSVIHPFNNVEESQQNVPNINLHKIIDSLKNKFTKGIRIEVAGRLTKRNTADRSVYKLRYKGNIKNLDSSIKKLPTVLLRGHAKSNLVYTQSKARLRIGAFGLKTRISSD